MTTEHTTIASIDGANLHKGVASQSWKLDYKKFRSWIRQKFGVTEACVFIGLIPSNAALYTALQNEGYKLFFKEITYDGTGRVKGNCDADLVLQAVRDMYEKKPKSAVLVTSDGDYAPLVRLWIEKGVPCTIVSPSPVTKCSILLKRVGVPIVYMADVAQKLTTRPK